jgi:hypothetical protein
MTNTNTNPDLGQRIEEMVREHIAASRKAAQDAVERAFASAAAAPTRAARRCAPSQNQKHRASAELVALGERFYEAVCAKPGEMMTVLATEVGASARELHRSVTLLRRAGRVRAVGTRSLTRYFPMANGAAASAWCRSFSGGGGEVGGEQGRRSRLVTLSLAALGEEREHVLFLFARSVSNRHQVLGEDVAAGALGAEGTLSPKYEGPDFTLGVVMPRPGLCRVGAVEVGRRSGASRCGSAGVFTDPA